MKPLLLPFVVVIAALGGCTELHLTALTEAPPGRTAAIDVETRTVTLTRGLALALECTVETEDYSGPCRQLDVSVDDEDVARLLPVHLDALTARVRDVDSTLLGSTVVDALANRQGIVVAAASAGETTLQFATTDATMELALVVEDPPSNDE